MICEIFNLSKKPGWEKHCRHNNEKNDSKYGKTITGLEINCEVLCRIGQGGNACKCV